MPTSCAGARRPNGSGAADPAAVEIALCNLLQTLQIDHRAVKLSPEEAEAILTRLRQERDERVARTLPI